MQSPAVDEARGLTAAQLDAIEDLERRVLAHDGGRLKLEWGSLRRRPPDEVNDFFVFDAGILVGFCGMYVFGREPELAGAVDPDHRRRGIGSALLGRALGHLARRGRTKVLLVAPDATKAGRRFALAKGATLDHSEHHLELVGPPLGPPEPRPSTAGLRIRPAGGADGSSIVPILQDAFGEGAADAGGTGPDDLAFVAERDGDVVGALRVELVGPSAGIYGLAVRPDLRGQGIGRAVLYEVCLEARRRGARSVTLEVETDNDRALGLYTSVGFERRTTEDYFALRVPAAASSDP
ncbi:MAG TPA: GNAT family N-acetyltransferase [Acidimicrobiales bacterium]|nr:GNAT family N-acetyltransferase [Acidimicrobiales bacterium]